MILTISIEKEIIELAFKILLPVIVGWVIGRERKRNDKSGGSRTMALICLTGSLLAILSVKSGFDNAGFYRLLAAGIQGISFVGMAVIIQHKGHIEGLTTAVTTFILVPLGFIFGLGQFTVGSIFSFVIFMVLESKYMFIKRGRK